MTTKKAKTDTPTTTNSTQPARYFDIAKPGSLPPASPNSRPVIVPTRRAMRDPMMAPPSQPASTDTRDPDSSSIRSPKLVIKPLNEDESYTIDQSNSADPQAAIEQSAAAAIKISDESKTKPEPVVEPPATSVKPEEKTIAELAAEGAAAKTDDKPASDEESDDKAKVEESTADEPKEDSKPKEDKPEPTSDSTDGIESTDSDAAHTKSEKETAQKEAEAKAQAELDDLVDQKTYFLPIKTSEQKHNHHVVVFGVILILVLAVAWLDIAMDAGIVTIPGLSPVTHFFGR